MFESTTTPDMPARTNRATGTSRARANVQNSFAPGAVDLPSLVPIMYTFMFRNIASDGFIYSDPQSPGDISRDSKPGCTIAAPSFPADTPGIDEDYVFNWVRDGAITAMEVAKAVMPTRPGGTVQTLNDYVQFADLCHSNAQPPLTKGHACFTIAGIDKPAGLQPAIDWLRQALAGHWDGSKYVSLMADPGNGAQPSPQNPVVSGYDPNIDIVQSAVYGAIPVTDTKLLATAAQLRSQWEEGGIAFYPINKADKEKFGIGPLFGRYPGDVYDGDTSHPVLGGHPWALCTCNVAELHYKLAAEIKSSGKVPVDDLSTPFFAQSGIDASTYLSAMRARAEAV